MEDIMHKTVDMDRSLRGQQHEPDEIWIAFSDVPHCLWLRPLRAGFRHCFAVLRMGDLWVTLDPLITGLSVMTHAAPPEFNLPQFLKDRGLVLVKTQKNIKERGFYFPMPLTCVEVMKRLLNLSAPLVLTPAQLYRALRTSEPKES